MFPYSIIQKISSPPRLFNPVLNELVVAFRLLDDVKIVLAPAGVNVRVAVILFFLSFVMGFQRSCRVAFVLLKPQNCVLCQILSGLLLRTIWGLFPPQFVRIPAAFPVAGVLLLSVYPLGTGFTVFRPVGTWNERRAADGAPLHPVLAVDFRFQWLVH